MEKLESLGISQPFLQQMREDEGRISAFVKLSMKKIDNIHLITINKHRRELCHKLSTINDSMCFRKKNDKKY